MYSLALVAAGFLLAIALLVLLISLALWISNREEDEAARREIDDKTQ